ncbi:MAG: CRISPR-associated endonuclease/helicase Cas3 [Bradymonadia bacterium]|jgi:CRISPR-associated endonuclease/helicase Cas3
MDGIPTSDKLWAKLESDADGRIQRWHPLLDHCADVAACFDAIVRCTILGQRLAHLIGQESLTEVQVARLTVLAALHDSGKANDGFQAQARGGPIVGHVREFICALTTRQPGAALFEAVGAVQLEAFFGKHAVELLFASIGHHGRPPAKDEMLGRTAGGFWSAHALQGLAELRDAALGWCPLATADAPPMPCTPEFVHAFNGVITLADWLGSDTTFFAYTEPGDPPRFEWAQDRAHMAIAAIGLDPRAARSAIGDGPIDFSRIVPVEGAQPRGVQDVMAKLALPDAASLTILEAPTGEGKTEAALLHYLRLFQAGRVDGIYFALPTRAPAHRLYTRITGVINRVFERDAPPVSQAVPGYLMADGVAGRRLPEFKVLWADEAFNRRQRGWSAEHTKRYLAGAVVVGTLDQVLLSVLKAPHTHLRAAGLLRLLLVVDAVHASSVYMGRLLDLALRRLHAAGGHTLLLSATLGAQARAVFLGQPAPTLEVAAATAYPLVTATGIAIPTRAIDVHRDKDVEWRLAPIADDDSAVAIQALTAAARGAKVLIIRNTVRRAIATQQALESLTRSGLADGRLFRVCGVTTLHHSGFACGDRNRLDAQIEVDFGKDAKASGRVAVGTQTIEQSLDLDADLLITDLAPIDVLLQRIGRLHRHRRERPAGFVTARVVVLGPRETNLAAYIQQSGEARGFDGVGTVYPDLRALSASRQLIEANPTVQIPRDCRRLVEHGLHADALAQIGDADDPRWRAHATALWGAQAHESDIAREVSLPWSTPFSESRFKLSDSLRAQTHLGAADRRVVFVTPQHGPFGREIDELTLPDYWTYGVEDDAQPTAIDVDSTGLYFTFGSRQFVYDRLGLRPIDDDWSRTIS